MAHRPKKLEEINAKDWNETAYIVGGGPSLKGFDWNLLGPDKFVVAINQSHRVLPHAQIVYFTDQHYWNPNKDSLLAHEGILVRGVLNPNNTEKHPRVTLMHLTGANGLENREGKLKHGSNSSYAAINMLAAHYGFKKIYLLGIDMRWGKTSDKSSTHWHGGYRRATPATTYNRMIQNYKTLLGPLKKLNVEVINIINKSCPSALPHFPKKTLEEVFGTFELKEEKYNFPESYQNARRPNQNRNVRNAQNRRTPRPNPKRASAPRRAPPRRHQQRKA